MSLSSSTLAAIQKAGAAVFTADEKLKQAAKTYADRVHAAIATNPYHLGNDALIENWKTVARLSQTLAGIEAEIKNVFQVAAQLTGEDQPTVVSAPVLATPKKASKKALVVPAVSAATDVVIKSKKKASKLKKASVSAPVVATPAKVTPAKVVAKAKPKAKAAAPKAKASPAKRVVVKVQPGELTGNVAKVFPQLERVLNTDTFTEISQTAIAKESGIALGSITAALKKLMELGRIAAGPAGGYKLTQPAQTVVATASTEAVAS